MPVYGLLGPFRESLPIITRKVGLEHLWVYGTYVGDLTALEGMNLRTFAFTPKSIAKGIEIIREMGSISKIGANGPYIIPPAEFWKKYDAGEFK